jgi:hypothetical protein
VKIIPNPQGEKICKFAKEQESARKDVKQAFGMLQSGWAITWHNIESRNNMRDDCQLWCNDAYPFGSSGACYIVGKSPLRGSTGCCTCMVGVLLRTHTRTYYIR